MLLASCNVFRMLLELLQVIIEPLVFICLVFWAYRKTEKLTVIQDMSDEFVNSFNVRFHTKIFILSIKKFHEANYCSQCVIGI